MEAPELGEVQKRVRQAISNLIKYDKYLLESVNERSISHRLAIHLGPEFEKWDIDCEYNRDHERIKSVRLDGPDSKTDDTEAKTVFPDIIIHQRGTGNNLLVIEIKKKKSANQDSREFDLKKLKAYREDLKYTYTLFLQFSTGNKDIDFKENWNP